MGGMHQLRGVREDPKRERRGGQETTKRRETGWIAPMDPWMDSWRRATASGTQTDRRMDERNTTSRQRRRGCIILSAGRQYV